MDNKLLSQAQDVFDCGFMLLLCAVGGLEFFESQDFSEKLKIFIDDLNKKSQDKSKYCCIIHNEDIISSIRLPSNENHNKLNTTQSNNKARTKHISILDFLTSNKFSKEFISFLCSSLKFDMAERGTLKSLLAHPFLLNSKENKGPGVSLPELLKISLQWTKSYILPAEYQGASERQLDRLIEALNVVLPNCEKVGGEIKDYSFLEGLNAGSAVVSELAQDLGLPAGKIWKRIEGLIKGLNEQAAASVISDGKLYG